MQAYLTLVRRELGGFFVSLTGYVIIASVLLLLGVAIMMFTISPLLAAVALTTVPMSVYAMKRIGARARPKLSSVWASFGWRARLAR